MIHQRHNQATRALAEEAERLERRKVYFGYLNQLARWTTIIAVVCAAGWGLIALATLRKWGLI